MTRRLATVALMDERTESGVGRIQAEIAVLFRRTRVYFRDAASDVHPDLQPAAYAVLVRLVVDGPMRASTIVDYFAADKGAVSRQVAQLEGLGFVRRDADPQDGRAQIIEATPIGVRRCRAARERNQRAMRDQLGNWDPSEVAMLGDLLHKFNTTAADVARERIDETDVKA